MEQDGIVVLHLTVLMADLLGRVMVKDIGLLSGVAELGQGGSKGNDWLILDNGNNSSDNYTSSIQAFPQGQAAGDPWAMWGTTDAYREMVYYRNCTFGSTDSSL